MALVKPDETIIGGGGTTNPSQRGIYITWNNWNQYDKRSGI